MVRPSAMTAQVAGSFSGMAAKSMVRALGQGVTPSGAMEEVEEVNEVKEVEEVEEVEEVDEVDEVEEVVEGLEIEERFLASRTPLGMTEGVGTGRGCGGGSALFSSTSSTSFASFASCFSPLPPSAGHSPLLSTLSSASDIVVSPRWPSRSILIRPRASMVFISYCVTTIPLVARSRGTRWVRGRAEITVPQGWMPRWRGASSSRRATWRMVFQGSSLMGRLRHCGKYLMASRISRTGRCGRRLVK